MWIVPTGVPINPLMSIITTIFGAVKTAEFYVGAFVAAAAGFMLCRGLDDLRYLISFIL